MPSETAGTFFFFLIPSFGSSGRSPMVDRTCVVYRECIKKTGGKLKYRRSGRSPGRERLLGEADK